MYSSLLKKAQMLFGETPPWVGRLLTHIPFEWRFGRAYRKHQRLLGKWERGELDLERFLTRRLTKCVEAAYDGVPFYRELFDSHGIRPMDIKSLSDFRKLPIVTKADLRSCPLDERSKKQFGRIKVNTGGTSGSPLAFYLDRSAYSREWAHMHWIWKRRGYRRSHMKLTFRGHDLGESVLRYNAAQNEVIVNSYQSSTKIAGAICKLLESYSIQWIHGYPSLVASFVKEEVRDNSAIREPLGRTLKGVFLASEYPASMYKEVIEGVLSTNVVCWYGHSEMAALAYESARERYMTLPTYGFVEAVEGGQPSGKRLVTTSLWNTVHPFIRYDTGDIIEPESGGSFLSSFRISGGRVGDFILDSEGGRVALTALIFGRHHEAFEYVDHVQVSQRIEGKACLILVPRDQSQKAPEELFQAFDFRNVKVDWSLVIAASPIRSSNGKVLLKIGQRELEAHSDKLLKVWCSRPDCCASV